MYFAVVAKNSRQEKVTTKDDVADERQTWTKTSVWVYTSENHGSSIEVPVTPETTVLNILECVRDPVRGDGYLLAVAGDTEYILQDGDNAYTFLYEIWNTTGTTPNFLLRYCSQQAEWPPPGLEARRHQTRQTGGPTVAMSKVPGGTGDLTLVQLQEMASRQQQVVETQQQVLVAKEQRLKYLKQQEVRHAQLASESERLRKIRERVENQELKLKKLRALRGQAEQYRINNGNLHSELEAVKSVFSEKEKELAMAVAKVDQLTRQLKDLKSGSSSGMYSNKQAALNSEVEKLRKELMMRNKLNEQQTNTIASKEKMLKERREKIAAMDAKIHELHQQLKQKQQQQQSSVQNNKAVKFNGQHPQSGGVTAPRVPHQSHDAKEGVGFAKHDMRYQLPSDIKHGSGENHSSRQQDVNMNELMEEHKLPGVLPVDSSASLHENLPRFGYSNKPPPPVRTSRSAGMLQDNILNQNTNISKTGQTQNSVGGSAVFGSHFFPPGQQQNSQTSLAAAGDGSRQNIGFPGSDASNSAPRFFQVPTTSSSSLPIINISDEERQAGSGQSSPACSESSPSATSGVLVKNEVNTSSVGPVSALIDKLNKSVGRPEGHNIPMASVAGPKRTNFTQRSQGPSQNGSSASQIPGRMAANEPPAGNVLGATQLNAQDLAIRLPPQLSQDEIDSSHTGSDSPNISAPSASSVNAPAPNQATLSSNSGLHLNQKPALTYRYASKNAIANTYMGRLGSAAMEKYQRNLNMLYQSVDTQGGRPAAEDSTPFTQSSTTDALSTGQDDPQFAAAVSSPSYPDIASDKGSFKLHTPKQVRRRHSDSENEDLNKALQEQQEGEQQQRLLQQQHLQQQQRLQQQQVVANVAGQDSQTVSDTDPSSPPADKSKPPTGKDKTAKNAQVSVDKKPSESASSPATASAALQKTESNRSSSGAGRSAVAPTDPVPKQTKSNLKKGGRRSNNRVSFDPLALLLDASLEGELDLVRKVALQVNNVSTPNDEGITALHNAICAGHYDIVTVLVELGCDVNAPDSDGWTPLHCAASCNNLPMVRFLVEHGACVFATTISDHETAADKCEEDEDGYDSCSDYLYSIQEKLGIVNNGEVYAVFDYQATNTDELSFQNGSKLTVLRKGDEVEKEWWWAQLNGREGYIPRNLLGLCPRVTSVTKISEC